MGRQDWQKLGNSELALPPLFYFHAPFPCIHHRQTTTFSPLKVHTSPFDTMLGSWYPEFVHIHVFMGIHETINDNQQDLKH